EVCTQPFDFVLRHYRCMGHAEDADEGDEGLGEGNLYRIAIDGLDTLEHFRCADSKLGRPLHLIQKRAIARTHSRIEQSGKRVYNILGAHLPPVVELHAFAEVEGPSEAVTRRGPGLSQGRHHVEVTIKSH